MPDLIRHPPFETNALWLCESEVQAVQVGIAWYRRSDYPRIRESMTDGEALPDTFDEWRGQAEKVERELRRAGHIVCRALLEPDEFVVWCSANGLKADAQARTRFAATPSHWEDTS